MAELSLVNNEDNNRDLSVQNNILGDAPSFEVQQFQAKMNELYPDILKRAEDLILAENRLPDFVDNDTDAGKLGDFIKQVKSSDKSVDAARKEETEVYLRGQKMVNGFFNTYREKLKKIADKAATVQAEYLRKKEDEERRRKEEEAARLRKEAEAKAEEARKIAEEAERKRKEAEDRERIAREEAERRQKEIEEARRKEREEAEAKQKAIEEKARKEREEAEAEIARIRAKAEEQAKIDAETKRQLKEAEERAKEAEKVAKAETKEIEKQLKESEKKSTQEIKEANMQLKAQEQEIKTLTREAQSADRESVRTLDSAIRVEKQADRMDRLADAKSADLARTRGLEGSVSTMRTVKVGVITSRADLELEPLRPYFRDEDLQFAVDQLVKSYGDSRTIKGVTIVEEDRIMVK